MIADELQAWIDERQVNRPAAARMLNIDLETLENVLGMPDGAGGYVGRMPESMIDDWFASEVRRRMAEPAGGRR